MECGLSMTMPGNIVKCGATQTPMFRMSGAMDENISTHQKQFSPRSIYHVIAHNRGTINDKPTVYFSFSGERPTNDKLTHIKSAADAEMEMEKRTYQSSNSLLTTLQFFLVTFFITLHPYPHSSINLQISKNPSSIHHALHSGRPLDPQSPTKSTHRCSADPNSKENHPAQVLLGANDTLSHHRRTSNCPQGPDQIPTRGIHHGDSPRRDIPDGAADGTGPIRRLLVRDVCGFGDIGRRG